MAHTHKAGELVHKELEARSEEVAGPHVQKEEIQVAVCEHIEGLALEEPHARVMQP